MPAPVTVKLRAGMLGAPIGRHPWVRREAIASAPKGARDGEEVTVTGPDGRFIARGFYHSKSQIAVRLYAWQDVPLDAAFFDAKLDRALELRRSLGLETDCRVVYSEGDGVSGLTIDRFGNYAVVQVSSLAILERLDSVIKWCRSRFNPKGIMLRVSKAVAEPEGMEPVDRVASGAVPDEPVTIHENGLSFLVDLKGGQKTGFFFDQRENRKLLASFARGGEALDLCCYTGGFSIALATAGARSVVGVDSSEPALALARRNAEANSVKGVTFEKGDISDWIKAHSDRRFDVVVLDPPRLAPTRGRLEEALRKYYALNKLAIERVKPGGFLATFSCSGATKADDLVSIVSSISRKGGRDCQILRIGHQAPDHPISAHCPETHYLKMVLCRLG